MLSAEARKQLLALADGSILEGLSSGHPLRVDVSALVPPLASAGAAFVTLRRNDELRGCIGTLEPYRPLAEDCVSNAFAAAFRDPRFPPVEGAEYPALHLHISVLGPTRSLLVSTEAELHDRLCPGEDGLVLEEGGRRATFLPSVWSQVEDPREFVRHLKRKAGLPDDYWSPSLRFGRYSTEEIRSSE